MKTEKHLTSDQVKKLGTRMVSRGGNVYRIAEAMFDGFEIGEGIFDRLKKEGDAFKCEQCDQWKIMAEIDDPNSDCDLCSDCVSGNDDE